jgi:hypothetical protein
MDTKCKHRIAPAAWLSPLFPLPDVYILYSVHGKDMVWLDAAAMPCARSSSDRAAFMTVGEMI